MRDAAERLDLIDAAIYGDVFDCAVTLDELWRYSRVRCTREALEARLAEPAFRSLLTRREGYFALVGRDELAGRRDDRRARARALRRRATRVAGWLRHVPFVRGILLTGSVAADDARPGSDVDVLVIVSAGRLASVFALLGSASRLVSRQVFCPNYYVSEAHLALERRSHYVARELAQGRALAGNAAELFAANAWVAEHLPNATAPAPEGRGSRGRSPLQRLLEWPLAGAFGDRVERRARALAQARLAAHHAAADAPVPEDVSRDLDAGVALRFHASSLVADALSSYEARRAEVGGWLLERLEAPRASAPPTQPAHGRVGPTAH